MAQLVHLVAFLERGRGRGRLIAKAESFSFFVLPRVTSYTIAMLHRCSFFSGYFILTPNVSIVACKCASIFGTQPRPWISLRKPDGEDSGCIQPRDQETSPMCHHANNSRPDAASQRRAAVVSKPYTGPVAFYHPTTIPAECHWHDPPLEDRICPSREPSKKKHGQNDVDL